MATAKVFRSGNSQAVRLPKEFRLGVDEVEITRDGDSLVLTPRTRSYGEQLVDVLYRVSEDLEIPGDLPPQGRPEL